MNGILVKTLKYISLPFIIVGIHWFSIYIYSRFCIPSNVYDILTSMISTGSPICSTLISIAEKTSSLYISTWTLLGVFILTLFNDFSKWFTNSSNTDNKG
jgi:hypothetical protein